MIYNIFVEVRCAKCHLTDNSGMSVRADNADAACKVAEFSAKDAARRNHFKEFNTEPGQSVWLCKSCHTPGPAAPQPAA